MVAIAPRFARIGFSERDDPDGVSAPRECREEDAAFDFAERAGAGFAIVFSLVFPFKPDAVEQSRRGGKRQSPFAGVRRALDRIEFEAHDREAVSVLRQ